MQEREKKPEWHIQIYRDVEPHTHTHTTICYFMFYDALETKSSAYLCMWVCVIGDTQFESNANCEWRVACAEHTCFE